MTRTPLKSHPSRIVAEALIAKGVLNAYDAVNPTWPTYVEHHPDVPDQLVCVYNTQGTLEDPTFEGDYGDKEGIQIKIRSTNRVAALDRARTIVLTTDDLVRELIVVAGYTYMIHVLHRTSGPFVLGPEQGGERKRYIYTINYLATITRES